jgi:hypothetical protein
VSLHKTRINGKTEFVFKCECGYTADSLTHKNYQFNPPVCPVCKKAIDLSRGEDLPEEARGKGY